MSVEDNKTDIFLNKKELEVSCLNEAIAKVPFLQKYKLIDDPFQERPDLILKNDTESIGIEHFHIDMLYKNSKKHVSLSRITYNEIKKMFEEYHVKVKNDSFEFQDAEDAGKGLEEILNALIDCQNNFDYKCFIKEWQRIFDSHYNHRKEYKKNVDKVGFIIEIRRYFKFPYICYQKNRGIKLDSKSIPITKEIAESLNKLDDGIDFYIIVVKGLFDDSVGVEYFNNKEMAKGQFDFFKLSPLPSNVKINIED